MRGTEMGNYDGYKYNALFNNPKGVAADASNNWYVADTGNKVIRKIDIFGNVTTYAGCGTKQSSPLISNSVGINKLKVDFGYPCSISYDYNKEMLYIADTDKNMIVRIDSSGFAFKFNSTVNRPSTVVAVNNIVFTNSFITMTESEIIALDDDDGISLGWTAFNAVTHYTLHFQRTNNSSVILAVDSNGSVNTINTTDSALGYNQPSGDVPIRTGLPPITGVMVNRRNRIYISCADHTIRRADSRGYSSTSTFEIISGAIDSSGSVDDVGTNARFYSPGEICANFDIYNELNARIIVADSSNNLIRNINLHYQDPAAEEQFNVTTIAGGIPIVPAGSSDGNTTDGPITWHELERESASFSNPNGLVVDTSGVVYVADSANNTIRRIVLVEDRVRPRFTNTNTYTVVGNDTSGNMDGVGIEAAFYEPKGLSIDMSGNLYVADTGNNTIRKVNIATKDVTTIAGTGEEGFHYGSALTAIMNSPDGLTVDPSGNVYIFDSGNNVIGLLSNGSISKYIYSVEDSNKPGSMDGISYETLFNGPFKLAIKKNGTTLFVTDKGNHAVREVSLADGSTTTFVGELGVEGTGDGIGTNAQFLAPAGIAINKKGVFAVSDSVGQTVRTVGNIVTGLP
jgi:sugar lactone lactonase YvrE